MVFALVFLAAAFVTLAQEHFPGVAWERVSDPAQVGWSQEKLQIARDYSKTISTEAVTIVLNGRVLDEWGATTNRFNVHSIRKSFVSALYGIHVHEGRIDLTATMGGLGIEDNEPALTPIEKTATVKQLLQARSGVYHPALYETAAMKAKRPLRGSHEPGTFWYYNNWDFNVLGTILEQQAHTKIFADFKQRIADPIGMQDFRVEDGKYVTGADSIHPAYPFRMTARDMARFGLLYLRQGRWKDRQVVAADWVKESTMSYSDAGSSGGYGYLWWIAANGKHLPGVELADGSYSARGAGGHYILVIPPMDLVIVHRVNTDIPARSVSSTEFGKLVRLILDAKVPPAVN